MVFNHKVWYQKNKNRLKKRVKERRDENLEEEREKDRIYSYKYYEKNKERIKEKKRANPKRNLKNIKTYKKKNILKVRARDNACKQIKIPKNQICEICNINLATQKHHSDYNKPLDVLFVCISCHSKLDRKPLRINGN